ncbi:MAG: relaxase/mobilization nuclease domain-containing protein [Bacteroidota bacterium]
MIGKITIGKSFGGCIRYCLEDKLELSHEEKLAMSKKDGLKHENRAEVLEYNMCYGNKKELVRQFNEVRTLRPQLSSPVMHITLSLDQEDVFTKEKLRQIGQDFAKEFGFEKNQYLVIYHQDTKHPHLHIVANRVGFDGSRINDSNSYRKVANLCRKLELKHELKQVLNPEKFMTLQQRQEHSHEQRIDQRKEKLKQNIMDCLLTATNFSDFIRKMEQQKIQVIKSRGISFIDDKKMKVKGSEVGYSLSTIEKILSHSLERRQRLCQQLEQEKKQSPKITPKQQSKSLSFTVSRNMEQRKNLDLNKALEILFRQERDFNQTPYELIHQKKKRKSQSQHLSR